MTLLPEFAQGYSFALDDYQVEGCEALEQGGTTFDALYVNVNGDSGYFDRSLQAYGRGGQPCGRCGAVMKKVHFMNRSSTFCPICQPFVGR